MVQSLRFGVQLGGLVVLGRILSPAEFGLMAMLTAIVGFGEVLRDFGLMAAAVQAKVLSREQQSNLFWINSSIGLVLTLLCVAASPAIAAFYGEPRLTPMGTVLGFTFLLTSAQTQFQARLTRQMRFRSLAVSDLLAQMFGVAAAIIGALLGLSYWALILQLLSQSLTLLVMRVSITQWVPGRPVAGVEMKRLLQFGRNLVSTQTLVYVSSNVDSLTMGAKYGSQDLGFYNRAFQILMMPLNQLFAPLTSVALPVLTRLTPDRTQYLRAVQRFQTALAYPACLGFAALAATAPILLPAVFGEQWKPSAAYFQILAIGGVAQSVGYVAYWVFLSNGLTAAHFRYSIISRSLLVAAIVIGSSFGPFGIAWGYTLGVSVAWPLSLWWLKRFSHIDTSHVFFCGLRVYAFSISVFLAGWLPMIWITNYGSIVSVACALCGMTFAGLALGASQYFRRDFGALLTVGNTVLARRAS